VRAARDAAHTAREKTNMATKSEQKFVVKKVKAGRGENVKSF
jgi:hypothetical protein